MPRTRKELLSWVKEILGEFKKPIKLSKSKSIELFEDYFNDNKLFICYEYPENYYLLIYSDIVFDELIYNIILADHLDTDTIIAELDFDTKQDLRKYVVEHLHLTL